MTQSSWSPLARKPVLLCRQCRPKAAEEEQPWGGALRARVYGAADCAERVGSRVTKERHGHDDDRRDERHHQRVLDGRRTLLLARALAENAPPRLHTVAQLKEHRFTPISRW